ncbi:MAG: hypothetical protein M3N08_08065 [Pseudomonadota bacterium]|nr:hypothetical protein [Pseudomonadota bacterium]
MMDPSFLTHALSTLKLASQHSMPSDLPATVWWLAPVALFFLGLTAVVDAFTGRIPDWLIFCGVVIITGVQGFSVDWPFAGEQLRWGIACGVGLWVINIAWERVFHHDAFGLGDAKWTILAVACFGFMPGVFAWGIGACLGIGWLAGLRLLTKKDAARVYFGPFLFVGLVIGLYWLKLRAL